VLKRKILGLSVLAATSDEAVAIVDTHLLERGGRGFVTFLNANVSNLAADDADLREALDHSLILNDGIGVGLASYVLHGAFFPDNLNGTDFIPYFLKGTRHTFRIFAVGSAEGVAERALDALREAAPRHAYVGACHGFFADADTATVTARIRDSGADLVLVAMGSPRQEVWAYRNLVRCSGPSAICVGGLLDFVAEEKPRAPQWVRALHGEWLFRLMVEPRRLWRRYLIGNAVFMRRLARACFRSRQA
jgi:alpha-1,3-mannosyltransferase